MDEYLKGIGAFALIIVGGAWLLRFFDERHAGKELNSCMAGIRARLASHPEDADMLRQEAHELLKNRPPRAKLF